MRRGLGHPSGCAGTWALLLRGLLDRMEREWAEPPSPESSSPEPRPEAAPLGPVVDPPVTSPTPQEWAPAIFRNLPEGCSAEEAERLVRAEMERRLRKL